VVVADRPLALGQPARIWVHGQGTVRDDGATPTEYGVYVRLRDGADTATLAQSTPGWDFGAGDVTMSLTSGGLLLTGSIGSLGAAFVAPPGSYRLQLVVRSDGGPCAAPKPDFGFNQGSGFGYVLLGTTPPA